MAKEQLNETATNLEKVANLALDRGLEFCGITSDPSSALADFEKAGALFSAAAAIRKRAKAED